MGGGLRGGFSREELAAALEGSEIGVWSWDIATNAVRWCVTTEALFGVPPGQFEGTYGAYLRAIHPDDHKALTTAINSSLEPGSPPYRVRYRIVRPDGATRWLECAGKVERSQDGTPIRLSGTAIDVTGHVHNELALKDSAEKLRLFSELASDYVYVAEMAAGFVPSIVAGSFERTTGYTMDELAKAGGWMSIVVPEDRPMLESSMPTLAKGHPLINEYRITDAAGELRWLRDHVHPVLDADTDELVQLVGGVQDITKAKQLESQLVHAQKMDALARLAGGVAHDFNNLLTIIFAALELIKLGDAIEENVRAEAMNDIAEASERAAELTQSLLAFGRKQIGAHELIDASSMLDAIKPMVTRAVGDKVTFHFKHFESPLPIFVCPGQLQLVVLNLAINASQAMDDSGDVTIRSFEATLGERDSNRPAELAPGTWAAIEVTDTGSGIAQEAIKHIFEPFFTTKEKGKGTGLGLAVSYGIIRQFGGSMTARNLPGGGAALTLYLPLSTDDRATAPRDRRPRSSEGGTETILLVEDEPAVRRLARQSLCARGYTVHEAGSHCEARELDRVLLESIDLLVSDIRLPDSDGTVMAKELVADYPRMRVLLTSGYLDDKNREELHASQSFSFLPKPFTPDGLARRVRETLDSPAATSGTSEQAE